MENARIGSVNSRSAANLLNSKENHYARSTIRLIAKSFLVISLMTPQFLYSQDDLPPTANVTASGDKEVVASITQVDQSSQPAPVLKAVVESSPLIETPVTIKAQAPTPTEKSVIEPENASGPAVESAPDEVSLLEYLSDSFAHKNSILWLIVASLLLPTVLRLWSESRSKKSFLIHSDQVVKNSLIQFGVTKPGDCKEIDDQTYLLFKRRPEIVMALHGEEDLPPLLEDMYAHMSMLEEQGSFPVQQYIGHDPGEIDHDHIQWRLSQRTMAAAFRFQVTADTASSSIEQLYQEPLYSFINPADESKSDESKLLRERWFASAYRSVEDLAEHYVAVQEFKRCIERDLRKFNLPFLILTLPWDVICSIVNSLKECKNHIRDTFSR